MKNALPIFVVAVLITSTLFAAWRTVSDKKDVEQKAAKTCVDTAYNMGAYNLVVCDKPEQHILLLNKTNSSDDEDGRWFVCKCPPYDSIDPKPEGLL